MSTLDFEAAKAAIAKKMEEDRAQLERKAAEELALLEKKREEHEEAQRRAEEKRAADRLRVLEAEAAAEDAEQAVKSAKVEHSNTVTDFQRAYAKLHNGNRHLAACKSAFTAADAALSAAVLQADEATAQVDAMSKKVTEAKGMEEAASDKLRKAKGEAAIKQAVSTWKKAHGNLMDAQKEHMTVQEAFYKYQAEQTAAEEAFETAQDALVAAHDTVDELNRVFQSYCILRASAAVDQSERKAKETHQTFTSLKRKLG